LQVLESLEQVKKIKYGFGRQTGGATAVPYIDTPKENADTNKNVCHAIDMSK
jgi:hypothetical protein